MADPEKDGDNDSRQRGADADSEPAAGASAVAGQERLDPETLCRRCGICCHEKVRFGEQVVITDIPCEFLDTETNLCTCYPQRFERQPRCSSAEMSVQANSLPGDCPYVGGRADYITPHLLSEHPEYERAVDALFPGARGKIRKTGASAAVPSAAAQKLKNQRTRKRHQ